MQPRKPNFWIPLLLWALLLGVTWMTDTGGASNAPETAIAAAIGR